MTSLAAHLLPRPAIEQEVARIRFAIDAGEAGGSRQDAEQLLARAAPADQALVLNALAHLHGANADVLAFARVAAQARSAAQAHGDVASEAEAILHGGQALQLIEDHAAAIKVFEEAEQLATRNDLRKLEPRIWRRLGISASIIGRHAQAVDMLERSVQACAALGGGADWFAARNSLLNAHNRRIDATLSGADLVEAYRPFLPLWDALATEALAAGAARISAVARGNYAIAQRYVEDYEGALDTLAVVLRQYQAFTMRAKSPSPSTRWARCFRLRRYADALAAHQNALWHLEDGSKREQRDAYAGISQAHEMMGDALAALGALKKVRALEAELTDQAAREAAERRELLLSVKQYSDQWEKLAKEDSLTGLPNRRALEQWLQSALSPRSRNRPRCC
jgi:tetratricopeptide (TPR) repeat protein